MKSSSYPDSCKYCKFSVYIDVSRETFCRFRGITESGDICKKYSFDPFKYKVKRIRTLNSTKFKKEDFEIN